MRAAEPGCELARLTRPHLNQVTVLPPGRPVCKGSRVYRASRSGGGGGSYQEIISRVRDRRSTGVRARGVKIALRGDKSVGTMFIEL